MGNSMASVFGRAFRRGYDDFGGRDWCAALFRYSKGRAMSETQKKTFMARRREHFEAKKEKINARWAPYTAKRASVEHRVSSFAEDLAGDYRFYTALCFVMAVGGFFFLQLMEVVALVGGVAMWQHWNRALGRPEQPETPGFSFWRSLSLVTIPVAAAGCAFMLFALVSGVLSGSWPSVR